MGNILSKTVTKNGTTNTINYTYGDSNWKDKLTAYDGNAISYDAIGNPLSYDGWSFTWQKGRQLAEMSDGTTSLSFKYNNDGIRTSKTVNGVETEYLLDGSTIIAQKTGNNTLWFYYDGNGKRVVMQNGDNGAYYYYVYNNQGDVIGLLDSDFNFVANYVYDSWGKVVSVTGSNTTIGNLNPFRYRGYYYDSETGLYYLQSRYYNPEIGRFINADSVIGANGDIISSNLFAYCSNNPVMFFDFAGTSVDSFGVSLGLTFFKFFYFGITVSRVWDDQGNKGTVIGFNSSIQITPSIPISLEYIHYPDYETIHDCDGNAMSIDVKHISVSVDENKKIGIGGTTSTSTSIGISSSELQGQDNTPKGHYWSGENPVPGFPNYIRQRSCEKCGYTIYYVYDDTPNSTNWMAHIGGVSCES